MMQKMGLRKGKAEKDRKRMLALGRLMVEKEDFKYRFYGYNRKKSWY